MLFQPNMKMADVIHMNYHLLQIILRFGINLGFGDKSIRQVCNDYEIDVDFFLEIINSYHHKQYSPKKHLRGFSLKLIVDYLRKSHDYYLKSKIPELSELLMRIATLPDNDPGNSIRLIDQFFNEYRTELEIHIQREEDKVYPYIFRIEKAYLNKKAEKEIVESIKEYSIDDFERDHDNVEDKLLDLKNILIKYLPVPVDPRLSQSILFELFRLEVDLRDHARIEDKILVPKVRYMERWLLDNYSS
ncbi:MAG TPA: hemerythrin domain-containing protein [Bacteroidales bacterium]|nr:hemerythrin domain-containing protein [Bacteroidales bacterium]